MGIPIIDVGKAEEITQAMKEEAEKARHEELEAKRLEDEAQKAAEAAQRDAEAEKTAEAIKREEEAQKAAEKAKAAAKPIRIRAAKALQWALIIVMVVFCILFFRVENGTI